MALFIREEQIEKKIDGIDAIIIFVATLICISVYFILFSKIIGGKYNLFVSVENVIDMFAFATICTAIIIVWKKTIGATYNKLLIAGLLVFSVTQVMNISIDTYLAVYPTSGVEKLHFYISIFNLVTAIIFPIGFIRFVRSEMKI